MAYKLKQIWDSPAVFLIEDFLTPRECSTFIQLAKKRKLREGRLISKKRSSLDKTFRDSLVLFLRRCQQKTLQRVEERIEKLTRIPRSYGEDFQIAYYKPGGFFIPHLDSSKESGLDRVVTLLIYLNEVEEGGETHFIDLGINIVPKKGRAVLWYNYKNIPLPDGKEKPFISLPKKLVIDEVYHGGNPVRKGEKWIVTKWLRSKPYERPAHDPY